MYVQNMATPNLLNADYLHNQLAPAPGLEELFAHEIVNATRRLELCTAQEAESKPQPAIDRTRAAAMRVLSHSLAELKKLQRERKAPQTEQPTPPPSTPFQTARASKRATPAPTESTQIARNATCPCGSGEKYKRCCGKFAPPLLMAA